MGGHFFTLAPEFSHLERTRKGGTKQDGWLVGAKFNYDHIKRYKIYWGVEALYSSGELRGKNREKDRIHSYFSNAWAEANIGYTLASKCAPYYSFTPYIGGGYFWDRNHFHRPSPLEVRFSTRFWYGSFGFLSHARVFRCFSAGLNARFKLPWEPKCTISGDPDHGKTSQQVGERLFFRIELPLVYTAPLFCNALQIGLMPFYESRVFGGRENYPFDFFETKYRIYGIDLQFIYAY
jgi:hypothetical protein